MSELRTLTIESVAAGGDGVARDAGLVVFVPRTAPGDRARVDVTMQGRFARGRLVALEEASAERVEPPCEHYVVDRCGGCQIQHLRYDAQLDVKGAIVADALARIGRRPTARPLVHASPAQWRYRRKLTLALRRRGDRWIAGLHRYDDPAAVFELVDCPITDERVLGVWDEVMHASRALPRATLLRGAVRLLEDGGASFVLEGGTRWDSLGEFADAAPSLHSIWWAPARERAREVVSRGAAMGASFAQVNPTVATALHARVVELTLGRAPARVVDAYAGAGDTAVAIAAAGVSLVALELDGEAARAAGARLPAGSRAVAGRVEDTLAAELPADVVIVNPPRTGLDATVARALDASAGATRAVIYVSCNPATLARDLGRMSAWRVQSLESFDMFPQTAHVETVCELVPEIS